MQGWEHQIVTKDYVTIARTSHASLCIPGVLYLLQAAARHATRQSASTPTAYAFIWTSTRGLG